MVRIRVKIRVKIRVRIGIKVRILAKIYNTKNLKIDCLKQPLERDGYTLKNSRVHVFPNRTS